MIFEVWRFCGGVGVGWWGGEGLGERWGVV